MDHQRPPLNPVIARIALEISYLKRELAITPKGKPVYTHAQLILAKIGMLSAAKEMITAHTEKQDDPF
jgi:hypothetical protein